MTTVVTVLAQGSAVCRTAPSPAASKPHLPQPQIANQEVVMKTRCIAASLVFAFSVIVGSSRSAVAADEWFVLSQASLSSANPSVEIKSEGGRWEKDVKKTKISVEGADVELSKVVLSWDNRPDDTLTDVGTVKAGGETAPKDAPMLKSRLKAVKVQYKIVGDAKSATLKVWGYD
jgi:hypothetical protein